MKKLISAILLTLAMFVPTPSWQPCVWAKPAATEKVAVVDINTADQTALQAVPGIGDAYSNKIIAGRPYKSKDELWRKKILPKGVYDKVKDSLIAKQTK